MTRPDTRFWRSRLGGLLWQLLSQGLTPRALAATLGVGLACSLFPFFGFTSLLNLVVGVGFRMNHLVLQLLNQLVGPLQVLMILPYVKLGEWLWRSPAGQRFDVLELPKAFSELSLAEFFARFGLAGLHALSAWLLTAPLLFACVYFPAQAVFRKRLGPLARNTL